MTLLRRVLGETLRGQRLRQRRTLREVSGAARVSLGYLSEVERGQKEASSELLASICEALDVRMSELLREVSDTMRRSERAGDVARAPARTLVPAGVGAPPTGAGRRVDPDGFEADRSREHTEHTDRPVDTDHETTARQPATGDAAAALVRPGLGATDPVGHAARAAALDRGRFERFGIDVGDLDGVDLAELETGDGLGELEVLLGLTDLLHRPDGGFGPGPMRGELAGAGAA
jgi:transcriptional regulator with XRE-family HTH domain